MRTTVLAQNCGSPTEQWSFGYIISLLLHQYKIPTLYCHVVAVRACIQPKPYLGYSSQLPIPMWQNWGLSFAVLVHKSLPHNPSNFSPVGQRLNISHETPGPIGGWVTRWGESHGRSSVNLAQSHWIRNEQTPNWHSDLLGGVIHQWCWQLWSSF